MDATATTIQTVETPSRALAARGRRGALSPQGEPGWVLQARLAAWETYERLPMPQRTDEE